MKVLKLMIIMPFKALWFFWLCCLTPMTFMIPDLISAGPWGWCVLGAMALTVDILLVQQYLENQKE